MTQKALGTMKPGEKGTIAKVGGAGVSRRVMDMGLVAGAQVEVERVAPLGDPVEVKVKGYHLTLRKEEAAGVMVEVE